MFSLKIRQEPQLEIKLFTINVYINLWGFSLIFHNNDMSNVYEKCNQLFKLIKPHQMKSRQFTKFDKDVLRKLGNCLLNDYINTGQTNHFLQGPRAPQPLCSASKML